ncbi:MAG: alpha-hydroxy acid oxidase [Gammaproteobacteria bacterium]
MSDSQHFVYRRAFLKFLASSPLLASFGLTAFGEESETPARTSSFLLDGPDIGQIGDIISAPDQAINVFDFKAAAKAALPPAHYGYLATGVDGDGTLLANREGFKELYIRPRHLVDVTNIDMSTALFGVKWDTPIVLAPTGSHRAFHPEGELAVARAANTRGHLQILSTVSTTSVEDVTEARGAPIWYQLYPTARWEVTKVFLRRAQAAGCPVVVLTVDLPVLSNRETFKRYARMDERDCASCHTGGFEHYPMFDGITLAPEEWAAPHLTWDFIKRLKDETDMKVIVKGIVTHEDASLCLEHGVEGIVVSNHGGRAEGSDRATISSLPEVLKAVDGKIPVLVDSGFRRGTDIFKALALGASGVCIGRPYLWGLSSFGQPGVEQVLDILRRELEITMKLCGTPTIGDISRAHIRGA